MVDELEHIPEDMGTKSQPYDVILARLLYNIKNDFHAWLRSGKVGSSMDMTTSMKLILILKMEIDRRGPLPHFLIQRNS